MHTRSLTRVVTTTLLALVISGVALVSQMPAAGAVTTADAKVQYGNASCGSPVLGAPVIGIARFVRSGDHLAPRISMTAGDPNTDYDLVLHDADTCAPLGVAGSFTTDAFGRARFMGGRIDVAGSTRFFAAAVDTSNFVGLTHGSMAVNLP